MSLLTGPFGWPHVLPLPLTAIRDGYHVENLIFEVDQPIKAGLCNIRYDAYITAVGRLLTIPYHVKRQVAKLEKPKGWCAWYIHDILPKLTYVISRYDDQSYSILVDDSYTHVFNIHEATRRFCPFAGCSYFQYEQCISVYRKVSDNVIIFQITQLNFSFSLKPM